MKKWFSVLFCSFLLSGSLPVYAAITQQQKLTMKREPEKLEDAKNKNNTKEFMSFSSSEYNSSLSELCSLMKQESGGFYLQDQMLPFQTCVNETIFSSSKYTAMVSKETECTTLVVAETGKDNIDTNSIPVILPNSHLILIFITLNSASEIFGIPFNFPSSASIIIV